MHIIVLISHNSCPHPNLYMTCFLVLVFVLLVFYKQCNFPQYFPNLLKTEVWQTKVHFDLHHVAENSRQFQGLQIYPQDCLFFLFQKRLVLEGTNQLDPRVRNNLLLNQWFAAQPTVRFKTANNITAQLTRDINTVN